MMWARIQLLPSMRGRHVHVRLEEEFTGEFPFCIGMTLGRLAVRTCDQHWKPQHRNVKRSEDGSLEKGSSNRRLLLVESFAVRDERGFFAEVFHAEQWAAAFDAFFGDGAPEDEGARHGEDEAGRVADGHRGSQLPRL